MEIAKEIILDTIEAFLLLGTFTALFNAKTFALQNKLRSFMFLVSFVTINFFVTRTIPLGIHTFVIIIFSILLLKYITRINFKEAAITYSLFFTIIIITENIISIIIMFILREDINEMLSHNIPMDIFLVVTKVFQIALVISLSKISFLSKDNNILKKEGSLIGYLIIQMGIFSFFSATINLSFFDEKNKMLFNAIIISTYFIFVVISIKDSRERQRLIDINNRYTVQELQLKNMEEIIRIIRQEKHDYANHINVVQALCTLDKPDAIYRIKEYVSTISDVIHKSFTYLSTGNDYVDAILSIKNNYAIQNSINFSVEINEPLNTLEIKQDQLISIVSNLVDNAFDALNSKENCEEKTVKVSTFIADGIYCIEVSNNGKVIPLCNVNKLFEKGYTTKVNSTQDHGYGLFITKQFVENNNGYIKIYNCRKC